MIYKEFNPDEIFDRSETFSEKYSSLERYFGNKDLTPLWIADMEFSAPKIITDAINTRANHPIYGYTTIDPEVKSSIKWWMQNEHSLEVEKNSILLSPTIITSLSATIEAFSNEGEDIALFSPAYGPFFWTIDRLNRNVNDIPLILDDEEYKIDFDLFEERAQTGKIKLLIFCSPHNPGGRVWRKDELQNLVKICDKYNILIFSDEIHSDIVYEPNRHVPLLTISNSEKLCVVAHSIGKTFNCSGLRASFLIAPEKKLRIPILKGLQKTNNDNVNMFGQAAIKAAFSKTGSLYKSELIDYLKTSRDIVCNKISGSVIKPIKPQGTFLIWTDFRRSGLDEKSIQEKIINEAGIALNHGTFFGESGNGFFRINFAHPREELIKAMDRLINIF